MTCHYCRDAASTTANGRHACGGCRATYLKVRKKQSDKASDWRDDFDRFCLGIGQRLRLAQSQVSEAEDSLAEIADG